MYCVCWRGEVRERDHMADLSVDGRIILKWIFKNGIDMVWIDLAQDRNMWRALLEAIMNLRVLHDAGSFMTS
jgi:hypothetical protein